MDHRYRLFAVFVASGGGCAHDPTLHPDVARVADRATWTLVNAETRVLSERDRVVAELAPTGGDRSGSNIALALIAGASFATGSVDVDLRGRGDDHAFLGIAFAVTSPDHFEAIYFRPFRFHDADPDQRAHAVQYVAWPNGTWEALRQHSPGVYETALAVAPDPARWFHARIEVLPNTVRVFVDHATTPALVVTRLGSGGGKLGLFVDSRPGSFANLVVRTGAAVQVSSNAPKSGERT